MDSEELGIKDLKNFNLIKKAILKQVCITCEFKNKIFELKPLKIAFFQGFWYLLALDSQKHDQFKKFYLKDISQIKLLERSFEFKGNFTKKLEKAHSVWFDLDKDYSAILSIDSVIAKYFKRKMPKGSRIIKEYEDGSVELEFEYSHEMELLPLVFHYIPYIKIVEPSELALKCKNIIAQYLV